MSLPHWAITYYTNSRSPRAKKWYRVARVIYIDHKWWELYWHPDITLRGVNRAVLYDTAKARGLFPLPGQFSAPPVQHSANELQWSLAGTGWAIEFMSEGLTHDNDNESGA
jgi:hypothetical protein